MSSLANEIIYGRQRDVEKLIAAGADVNELDQYGYTPLIEAAIANNVDIAKLLLEHGAKVNERDITGGSALHWAAENHNLELCKLLLNQGADPNAYTRYSQPVLLQPLLRRQQDLKELLYHYGADLKFAQDYINTKLVGHRFELTGKVDIIDSSGKFVEINFEGFILEFTIGIIQDSLMHFKNNFAARNLRSYFNYIQRIIDTLAVASELIKYQQYLTDVDMHRDRIRALINRNLLLMPVGYEGHAVTFARYGDLFAKCDRGENSLSEHSVMIYKIGNPAAFNYEFIKFLLYNVQDRHTIHSKLNKILGLVPYTYLSLGSQIAGNCSWANVEGSIPMMFLLMLLKEKPDPSVEEINYYKKIVFDVFQQWQEWDKDWALHQCIESFYDANRARKASKAAVLAAVLFQKCDHNVPKDLQRAAKILPILSTPDYKYILNTYLEVYKGTPEGENLLQLIDLCGA